MHFVLLGCVFAPECWGSHHAFFRVAHAISVSFYHNRTHLNCQSVHRLGCMQQPCAGIGPDGHLRYLGTQSRDGGRACGSGKLRRQGQHWQWCPVEYCPQPHRELRCQCRRWQHCREQRRDITDGIGQHGTQSRCRSGRHRKQQQPDQQRFDQHDQPIQ